MTREPRPARSRVARAAWTALGAALVALGAVGIVLPGLPTTPFLILAAACFVRSSPRMYGWLLAHRTFGPLIRDYREGRGVDRRVKLVALGSMGLFVAFALGPGLPEGWNGLRWLVAAGAVVGALYLYRLPERRA